MIDLRQGSDQIYLFKEMTFLQWGLVSSDTAATDSLNVYCPYKSKHWYSFVCARLLVIDSVCV